MSLSTEPSSREGFVEIHRIPKDNWIKDLDTLVNKTNKDTSHTALSQTGPKSPTPSLVSIVCYVLDGYTGMVTPRQQICTSICLMFIYIHVFTKFIDTFTMLENPMKLLH